MSGMFVAVIKAKERKYFKEKNVQDSREIMFLKMYKKY